MNNFYQIANKESLTDNKKMIKLYGLDPVCLNYLRCGINTPEDYHPTHRNKVNSIEYKIYVPVYGVSWSTELKPNKKNYLSIKKFIAKQKKTKAFFDAVKDNFNCMYLEACIIWSDSALKSIYKTEDFKRIDKWYSDIKGANIYPIDKKYFCLNDFKEEYKKLQSHCEKLLKIGNIIKYEIRPRYKQIHFLPEEYDELKSLPLSGKTKEISNLMLTQAIKVKSSYNDTKREFKEVVLSSTGRRLKYDINPSMWTFAWSEVDPIVNKTIKGELKLKDPKKKV